MCLMSKEIQDLLPPLYTRENDDPESVIVPVKWFHPSSNWTWYAIEMNPDGTCFGLVKGLETELGYWQISELEQVSARMPFPIERDLHWNPKTTLAQVNSGEVS